MEVKIKKLHPDAVIPCKKTDGAVAYDVFTPRYVEVKVGRQAIPLDFAIELPKGYEAKIEARSGFSLNGMIGINTYTGEEKSFDADVIPGKIDYDFRGNVSVIIYSRACFGLKKGTRIAQLTIYKTEEVNFNEVLSLSKTERGEGGFGHTGTN